MNDLLPTPPVQGEFFGFVNPTAGEELTRARPPEHTGERASRDYERVQEIIAAYVAGEPVRSVCRRFAVGHNTLSRLLELHPQVVDTEKKRVSARLGRIARLFLDRLEMEGHLLPVGQLSVALGIVLDKKAMVDGDPTSRIEHVATRELTPEQVQAALDQIKRAAIPVDSEVIHPAIHAESEPVQVTQKEGVT